MPTMLPEWISNKNTLTIAGLKFVMRGRLNMHATHTTYKEENSPEECHAKFLREICLMVVSN